MEKQKLYLLLWLALSGLGAHSGYAQKGAKTIVDAGSRQPLDYVSIQSDDNSIKLLSNKDGKFIFVSDARLKFFKFYKMGYVPLTLPVEKLSASDTVFLSARQVQLQEVTVSSAKLSPLVMDKHYYVEDYTVLPDENFLLITYKSEPNDVEVCYYDQYRGIRQSKKIRAEPGAHFVTDCFKNLHVLTERYSRQVFFDSDTSFGFLPKYPRRVFDSTLAGCVLKMDTQVIMKYMLPPSALVFEQFDSQLNSPFVSYYRISRNSRELFYLAGYNERMREMLKHEIEDTRLMQSRIWAMHAQYALFYNQIATPVYSPVFLKNDTVVLFDFQENKIAFLNQSGVVLKQVPLDKDQFGTLRNFEILCDRPAQKFYIRMRDAGRSYLRSIDIYSGKITSTLKLEKIFAKNIQVVNNKLYYLVREKGWDDTQYLYRQN